MSIDGDRELPDGAIAPDGAYEIDGSGGPPEPFSELCRKVVLLADSDAFILSHFRPLIAVLREMAHEVVVLARDTGSLAEVRALGTRVIDFDFSPAPARRARRLAGMVWSLARAIEGEEPDVLHTVGLRPSVIAALSLKLVSVPRVVVHMTGLGALRIARDRRGKLYRGAALRALGTVLNRPTTYLLVENVDDLALLREAAADPGARFAVLGGAGVDPQTIAATPPPTHATPVAAYVGRMVRAKGADVFMQAFDMLGSDVALRPLMCGRCDETDPDALPAAQVRDWCAGHGGVWREHVEDVGEVWRNADVYVLPARGGEGLPRAMLEAAASRRPLIVSNVPGCRDFVRNGIEGLLVTPGDPAALAQAMTRLAGDGALREQMGEAARMRLLHGFTEAHVMQALRQTYAAMFMQRT